MSALAGRTVAVPLELVRLLDARSVGGLLVDAISASCCQGHADAAERLGTFAKGLDEPSFAALVAAVMPSVGAAEPKPLVIGVRDASGGEHVVPVRRARKASVSVVVEARNTEPKVSEEAAPREPRAAVVNAIAWLGVDASAPKIVERTGLTDGQVRGQLKRLIEIGAVSVTGAKRSTRYVLVRQAAAEGETAGA